MKYTKEQIKGELERRKALRSEQSQNPFSNASPTGKEYLIQQGQALKAVPGQIYGVLSNIPGAVKENPQQFAAGIPQGIASIADIPAMLYNLGAMVPEKVAAYKYGQENVQPTSLPYFFHDTVAKGVDQLVGEPINASEQSARLGGDLASILLNPGRATSTVKEAGNLAKINAGKVANKITSFNPEKYEQFKAAGIDPRLGEVSNSRVIKRGENLLAETPGGASKITNHYKNRENQLENIFNENVKQSSVSTPREAGKNIKTGAQAYNDKVRDISSKLYDKAYSKLPPAAPVNLENTAAKIDELLYDITPEAVEILTSSPAGKTLQTFRETIKNNNGSLPISSLKNVFRPSFNKLIDDFQQVGTAEQAKLKTLVSTLSEDMNSALLKNHPEAAKALQRADSFWSKYSKENRKITNSLVNDKTSNMSAFRVAKNALKQGDENKVKVITSRMSAQEKEAFSSSMINEFGLKNGEFNADVWAKEYLKLRPEARKALAIGLPKNSASKLESVAKALETAKQARGVGNPSGTTYTGILAGMIGTTLTGLYTGSPWVAASPVALAGVANVSAGMATSKKLIDALYLASKAKTPEAAKKAIPVLAEAAARANISLDGAKEAETSGLSTKPQESKKSTKKPIFTREEIKAELSRRKAQQNQQPQTKNEVDAIIHNSASSAGLNPTFVRRVAQVESGLKPDAKNSNSSASGLFQFTDGTWRKMVDKYGKELGVSFKDKNNPEANARMGSLFLKDNAIQLSKTIGRTPSPGEVYASHFLGLGGAVKLIKNYGKQTSAAAVFPKEARANPTIFYKKGKPLTVEQLYNFFSKKMAV